MTRPADLPRAPAHVQPYLDALGPEAGVAFLLEFGGSKLYLARDPEGRSEVEALVGRARMQALSAMRPGEVIRVPTCRRWLAHVLAARGMAVNRICRKLHVTDVAIYKYLDEPSDNSSKSVEARGSAAEDRQLSLPL